MAITLEMLKAFEEVATTGNISRAAARLGLTQPALSWSIRKLESETDVQLFVRSKKGVHLTKAGELFRNRAQSLTRQWDGLLRALHQDSEDLRGTYQLGVHSTVAAFTLPRFCPQLWQDYPEIDLILSHDLSRNVAEGVINFKYDLGIVVNPPRHADLTIVDLYPDMIRFWCRDQASPLQDPFSEQALVMVNPEMLQTEPLLNQARKLGMFQKARLVQTTDLLVIAQMTAAGGGIGLLPATVALNMNRGLLPLADSPFYKDAICLIWRADLQRGQASKVIRDSIIQAFT